MHQKSVALLTSSDPPPSFHQDLSTAGINLLYINTLTFQYDHLTNHLCQQLLESQFQGIVFTSPRCVHALKLTEPLLLNHFELIKQKKFFAVGSGTERHIKENFNIDCEIVGTQGAQALAQQIIELQGIEKLIYLQGDKPSPIPNEIYEQQNIQTIPVQCYTTQQVGQEEFLGQLGDNQGVCAFVFCSPSAVELVEQYVELREHQKLYAIGETTAKKMQEVIGRVDAVAYPHSLEGVKELLLERVGEIFSG